MEETLGYTNSAYAVISNNSGVTLKSVTLHHQYSNDAEQSKTWTNVAPNTTAAPSLEVGYNTGFIRYGQDYWWVEYTLPDDSVWVTNGNMTQTLHPGDQGTTKVFTISGTILTGFLGDTTQLHLGASPGYNTWAAVVLRNNFPIPVAANLRHKYSGDAYYNHLWEPIPANTTTPVDEAFIVYYNTGFIRYGSDYWTLTAFLNIPPYENAPSYAFSPFSNATQDKGCMLEASDNGKVQTFTVDGTGLTLGIGSGSCTDSWKTWNGYNTLAFIQVKNGFSTAISTVTLSHQYSSDQVWYQTRGLIKPDGLAPWMVAEYNTGLFHPGLDYWNIYVYLEDGTWYQNSKANKECFLSTVDAITPPVFTVSTSSFQLGLRSGACSDGMSYKGTFSPLAGRDVNRRYDQNGYIGSHNAYANFAEGFWYAQQTGSVPTQLALGATVLLLDIWYKDNEVYLLHNGIAALQPFAALVRLSDALTTIKTFLQLQSRDPVTIIFEDRVPAANQNLIKQAFVTSGTWDMVFNPDAYGVSQKGWPTLAGFFTLAKPIIVMTSNRNSADFAYQWRYMSENVYGNASLNQATWLNARSESQPLSQLALCALNHFPTFSTSGFSLPAWLNQANTDNATALLATMIDACETTWNRYPNYINADFWELPPSGLINAITYLNSKLHGTPSPILRVQHGRAILTELDHSRLLGGDWERATGWIDQHLADFCPALDADQAGPLVYRLTNVVNLTLIVSVLASILPVEGHPGDSAVRAWVAAAMHDLVRYLLDIEPRVLEALEGENASADGLCAIPYFLVERACGISFGVTGLLRSRLSAGADPGPASQDSLLLAGLAGRPEGASGLAAARITSRAEATEAAGTTGMPNTSRSYDLTHEILYLHLLNQGTAAEPGLAEELESLLGQVMDKNQDLGAELLACYWIAGGAASAASRGAAERLKAYNEEMPSECQPGRDAECHCPKFKEQIHNRLTMVLGLGATLAIAGEVLAPEAPAPPAAPAT